jgi:hypothetical protein
MIRHDEGAGIVEQCLPTATNSGRKRTEYWNCPIRYARDPISDNDVTNTLQHNNLNNSSENYVFLE